MSDRIRIYHNPRCSKSRETLRKVVDAGFDPEIVEYRKTGVTVDELERILDILQTDAHGIVRSKESAYRSEGLSPGAPGRVVLQAICDHPELLERPIVIRGHRGTIGRPPDRVDELLD